MSNRVSLWVKRLGTRPLPVIAAVSARLESLLASPTTDFPHLGDALRLDPGFCTHLSHTAGKALGQNHDPCVTPAHALSLIGEGALHEAVRKLPALGDQAQGLRRCYAQAAQAAFFADRWAHRLGDRHPEEIALAALFQDLPEMALRVQMAKEMAGVQKRIEAGASRDEAAKAVLGCTLDEIGLGLARLWSLPRFCCEAFETAGHFHVRALLAKLAAELSRTSYIGWRSPRMPELIEILAEFLDIEPAEAQAELHSASAAAARELFVLGLPLNIHRLLSEPTAQQHDHKQEKPAAASQKASAQPASRPEAGKPTPGSLHGALQRSMQMMREHAGVTRVLLAMLSPDRRQLQARFVLDADGSSPFRKFNAETTDKNFFNLLLSKPQALWINPDNHDKFLPLMPEDFRNMADPRGFFTMSLFVKNRSIGLFYADAAPDGALGAQEYDRFKQLCQRVANSMNR